MAEAPSSDAGQGLAHPLTPSSPYRPTSLTPVVARPRLGPRRQSRFTEEVMTEHTPAASVSERSMDYHWYGPSSENVHTNTDTANQSSKPNTDATPSGPTGRNWETWLRFLNGSLHAVPCLVLLAILGYGLRVLRANMASHMSIQAIILICLLFFDVVLDVVTLFRAQRRWPTWVLALRFGIGIAYIVLFLLYVGLGGVFPNGYTYWGVPVDSSATPVYVLLCVEGLWDLLHIPVCRYALGSSLLGRASARPNTSTTPDSRTTFNHRFSVAGTEHSSISLTWQRWVRAGSAHHSRDELETGLHRNGTPRGPSVDLTLREHPDEEEEDDDDDEGGSSRPGSSHERKDEESGLQGGGEEKWDEDKSEGRAAHRVRAADIGQ